MRIAVLGTGHYGSTTAADLALKGHSVVLIKTSQAGNSANFEKIMSTGEIVLTKPGHADRVAKISLVTTDLAQMHDADVVLVCIESSYQEDLVRRMAPFVNSEQILLFNPGYLATAFVLEFCETLPFSVVEATSSFIDSRVLAPGVANDSFRNVKDPVGVYPVSRTAATLARLAPLGYPLVPFDSVVEVALHNPNFIVHVLPTITAIARIEAPETAPIPYHEVFSPTVWRMLERLDEEKLNLLEALGYPRLSYADASKLRNADSDDDRSGEEIFRWWAARPEMETVRWPDRVDTRFVTEDVPQGLVLVESLGRRFGIATPMSTALIELSGAALDTDFRAEGRTIERLGQANVDQILQDADSAHHLP